MFPNQVARSSLSSSGGILKKINWSSILDNTQKTLGVINQAIPIVYQVKPIINNARTMFRIADVMKVSDDTNSSNGANNNILETSNNDIKSNKPIFYI